MRKIWGLFVRVSNACFVRRAGFWTLLFTAVIAIVTVQIRDIYKLMDQTSRTSGRAFVVFQSNLGGGVGLYGPDPKDAKKQIRVGQEVVMNLENTGPTPARSVVAFSNQQTWRGDLPEGFDFHDLNPIPTNMPINVIGPRQVLPIKIVVPLDNFIATHNGTERQFFWGWAVYKDAFPDTPDRLTEFCVEMIQVAWDTKKPVTDLSNVIAWNTQQCRQHNCYDQDCKDYDARIKEAR